MIRDGLTSIEKGRLQMNRQLKSENMIEILKCAKKYVISIFKKE